MLGITTRAPRSLSDRHRLSSAALPHFVGGRSLQPLSYLAERACPRSTTLDYHAQKVLPERARPHSLRRVLSVAAAPARARTLGGNAGRAQTARGGCAYG